MRVREAWRLSRVSYAEVAYRSVQSSRGSTQGLGVEGSSLNRLYTMIMRSAKISKIAFAIFGTIGASIPFLDFVVTPGPESLVSAISLSLAISMAYVVFYSLQVLPSFSNAEPFSLLSTLPLADGDFSLVALFSFVRTFDFLVIGTGAMQVLAVWILTGSPISTAIMVVAVFVNVVFAAAAALWFSGIFYRNVSRGGRSKRASLGRVFFLITWGFGALSIAFLFDLISFILPYLNNIVGANASQPSVVLLIFHPFPLSILISNFYYPSLLSTSAPNLATALVVYGASICYFPLAFLIGKRTFHSVSAIARGRDVKVIQRSKGDMKVKVRSSLGAQVMKDLRIASRNPSVAFLFALPFFVVFVLGIITSQFVIMRASAIFASTIVGCSFTVMICSTLLSTEAVGMEYTLSLPIKTKQIVNAKALISTLTFAPVPFALFFIALSRELTSSLLPLIPFAEIPAMYAACVAQVSFYMGNFSSSNRALGKSKGFSPMAGGDLRRLAESLSLSFAFLMIPIIGYTIEFYLESSHFFAFTVMVLLALIELGYALRNTMIGKADCDDGENHADNSKRI